MSSQITSENAFDRIESNVKQSIEQCRQRIFEIQSQISDYKHVEGSLNEMAKTLTKQMQVPVGSMALVDGKVTHTNRVLVHLGQDTYVHRSVCQANEIIGRRIDILNNNIQIANENIQQLEKKLANIELLKHPEIPEQEEPIFDIHEELDEDGNVITSTLRPQQPEGVIKSFIESLKDEKQGPELSRIQEIPEKARSPSSSSCSSEEEDRHLAIHDQEEQTSDSSIGEEDEQLGPMTGCIGVPSELFELEKVSKALEEEEQQDNNNDDDDDDDEESEDEYGRTRGLLVPHLSTRFPFDNNRNEQNHHDNSHKSVKFQDHIKVKKFKKNMPASAMSFAKSGPGETQKLSKQENKPSLVPSRFSQMQFTKEIFAAMKNNNNNKQQQQGKEDMNPISDVFERPPPPVQEEKVSRFKQERQKTPGAKKNKHHKKKNSETVMKDEIIERQHPPITTHDSDEDEVYNPEIHRQEIEAQYHALRAKLFTKQQQQQQRLGSINLSPHDDEQEDEEEEGFIPLDEETHQPVKMSRFKQARLGI